MHPAALLRAVEDGLQGIPSAVAEVAPSLLAGLDLLVEPDLVSNGAVLLAFPITFVDVL